MEQHDEIETVEEFASKISSPKLTDDTTALVFKFDEEEADRSEDCEVGCVPMVNSTERCQKLANALMGACGEAAQICARAPGRVNLIGEHIDYCGYSVLPMALDQDVLMVAHVHEDVEMLQIFNVDEEKYTTYRADTIRPMTMLDKSGSSACMWFDYVRCGLQGVRDWAESRSLEWPRIGLSIMVEGNVPPEAGLSSSSAVVVAAAVLAARATGWHRLLSRTALAEICATSERYIGTQGGGMDQAIALLAEAGTARFIIFEPQPLRALAVHLPEGACFVVAHSGVLLNKAASSQFNERVVECRLAARTLVALAAAAGETGAHWSQVRRLADAASVVGCTSDLKRAVALCERYLHEADYTREELLALLAISADEFDLQQLSPNTRHMQHFRLRQRAIHVFSEAARVLRFRAVCEDTAQADAEQSVAAIGQLGQLMSASHASCRDLYQCSHPQLDKLVDSCVALGALGARLTGAGWGGCAVALVEQNNVAHFVKQLRAVFYEAQGVQPLALFATAPAQGAQLLRLYRETVGL